MFVIQLFLLLGFASYVETVKALVSHPDIVVASACSRALEALTEDALCLVDPACDDSFPPAALSDGGLETANGILDPRLGCLLVIEACDTVFQVGRTVVNSVLDCNQAAEAVDGACHVVDPYTGLCSYVLAPVFLNACTTAVNAGLAFGADQCKAAAGCQDTLSTKGQGSLTQPALSDDDCVFDLACDILFQLIDQTMVPIDNGFGCDWVNLYTVSEACALVAPFFGDDTSEICAKGLSDVFSNACTTAVNAGLTFGADQCTAAAGCPPASSTTSLRFERRLALVSSGDSSGVPCSQVKTAAQALFDGVLKVVGGGITFEMQCDISKAEAYDACFLGPALEACVDVLTFVMENQCMATVGAGGTYSQAQCEADMTAVNGCLPDQAKLVEAAPAPTQHTLEASGVPCSQVKTAAEALFEGVLKVDVITFEMACDISKAEAYDACFLGPALEACVYVLTFAMENQCMATVGAGGTYSQAQCEADMTAVNGCLPDQAKLVEAAPAPTQHTLKATDIMCTDLETVCTIIGQTPEGSCDDIDQYAMVAEEACSVLFYREEDWCTAVMAQIIQGECKPYPNATWGTTQCKAAVNASGLCVLPWATLVAAEDARTCLAAKHENVDLGCEVVAGLGNLAGLGTPDPTPAPTLPPTLPPTATFSIPGRRLNY